MDRLGTPLTWVQSTGQENERRIRQKSEVYTRGVSEVLLVGRVGKPWETDAPVVDRGWHGTAISSVVARYAPDAQITEVWVVPFAVGSRLQIGRARRLFTTSGLIGAMAMGADGERLLVVMANHGPSADRVNLVLNWSSRSGLATPSEP